MNNKYKQNHWIDRYATTACEWMVGISIFLLIINNLWR